MIRLESNDWSATVSPDLGGALLGLNHGGRPIFRPTPPGARQILETACFPLLPYANRIADARFRFGGQDVVLPVLPQFAPHALHGDGWLRPWTPVRQDGASVTLTLDGGGDHWPWPWSATQTIALSADGLRIELSLTNRDSRPAPAGLGLHPYFHRRPDARLRAPTAQVWLTGADEIPERLAPASALVDWSEGVALEHAPSVDHAYAMRQAGAVLEDGAGGVVMTASANCRWAQIYAPPGVDFLCVEPVTHRPDAIHSPPGEDSGLAILAPGESLSIWMTVGVRA